MISYKASYTKADLYELLSKYQKRLEKKVQEIAHKVINMSNIEVFPPQQIKKSSSINPEKQKNTRSISMIQSVQKPASFIPKHQIISNIQDKLGGHHLPKIKGDKDKQKDLKNVKQRFTRSIGRNKYKKPKFPVMRPNILPKEIRNNPFSEPRAVPVSQLKHGLLNLMNKGVINKDVDISVAFEWGQAPFQSKGAVIHSYDEVLIQQELEVSKILKQKRDEQMPSFPSSFKKVQPAIEQRQGWAITGLDAAIPPLKLNDANKQQKPLFSDITHIEFRNYVLRNQSKQFTQYKRKHIQTWGQILTVFKFIQNYLRKYTISLAFVDGRKVVTHCLSLYKIRQKEIKDCIIGSLEDKRKLQSLKRIPNGTNKQKIAGQTILKLLKANVIRNQYKHTQLIIQSKIKIARWIENLKEKKKTRAKILVNIAQRNKRIKTIQTEFQINYDSIISSKHYQIHIPSHPINDLTMFIERLNTEVTRIFHLKSNINIIYVSPIKMSEQTINYYYKIMELGEVQNYKDRVKFVDCQSHIFLQKETLSRRLYYSSKSLRQIKKITKGVHSVIVSGQLEQANWYLVDALKTPSVSNFRQYELTKRSAALQLFRTLDVPYITFWKIDITPTGQFYLNELARKLGNFASDNRLKSIQIRIDSIPGSIATIKCPIKSYDDMVNRIAIQNIQKYPNPQLYFKLLLKLGGVAEKHDQFRHLRSLIYVTPNQKISILGTFQKIQTSNFSTVGVCFPQQVMDNQSIEDVINTLTDALIKDIKFYGYLEVDFIVDKSNLMLEGINWQLSEIGSSIFYFQYLANARQTAQGQYQSQIIESQLSITINEYRSYVYSPYILHFGLNQFQLKNFFQLCRSQGISFDLQKKYGSAFALLEGVKNAVGILATAKSTKIALGLIIQAIGFIYRQTVKNLNEDREERMKDPHNILNIKSKLEECYNRGIYD